MKNKYLNYLNYLKKFLFDYLNKNKIENIIIGLSGGLDSALSLSILKDTIKNDNIFAYFIDIHSNKKDLSDAKKIADSLKIKLNIINLSETFNKMIKDFNVKNQNSKNNIKSRLRTLYLYSVANDNNGIVLGNSNYSELFLGYFTKFGDNACDLNLLGNLTKSEVIELSKLQTLPSWLLSKKPSAGLFDGQTDESDFGFSYNELDNFLNKKDKFNTLNDKIKNIHNNNLHKLKIVFPKKKIRNIRRKIWKQKRKLF